MTDTIDVLPLPDTSFGGLILADEAETFVAAAEAAPDVLPAALCDAHGMLVLKGLGAVSGDPEMLLRLSRLFGKEVESYRETTNRTNLIHPEIPQIYVISNLPPMCRQPPDPPSPPRLPDGGLPVQFPHRRGWHTDQSFRRPPPDVSLFYAVASAPKGQGQTLYADGIQAWRTLPSRLKEKAEALQGLHVAPFRGHGEDDVRAGRPPLELDAKDGPQPQPVVRRHPVTGEKALYLCESGQMDWINGPLVGMEPGVDGDGARLLYELMEHFTRPAFVYVHEWKEGDLVIYDNRCTIHCATWFDAESHGRIMWRTTVWGNPGACYEGERRSWEGGGESEGA